VLREDTFPTSGDECQWWEYSKLNRRGKRRDVGEKDSEGRGRGSITSSHTGLTKKGSF